MSNGFVDLYNNKELKLLVEKGSKGRKWKKSMVRKDV